MNQQFQIGRRNGAQVSHALVLERVDTGAHLIVTRGKGTGTWGPRCLQLTGKLGWGQNLPKVLMG